VAVASAGQYASLHLAPNRQPHQHLTTQSFTGRMPFLPPNQQRHSTEGHLLLGTCQKKSNFEKKTRLWNTLPVDVCQLPPDSFKIQQFPFHLSNGLCPVLIVCAALCVFAIFE